MGAIKGKSVVLRCLARGSLVLCSLALPSACGDGEEEPTEEEPEPEPSPSPTSEVVTFEDIHPTLVRTCTGSECHGAGTTMRPGPIADPDLETAREAAEDDKLLIAAMIETGTMPDGQNCLSSSGEFSTKRTCLSEEERMAVTLWATR